MSIMPNGAINRTEFYAARDQFKNRFLVNDTTVPNGTAQRFTFGELVDLVDEIDEPYRLVVVHYGLVGDDLQYGFSFNHGKKVDGKDVYTYDKQENPSHLLTPAGFVPIAAVDWEPMRKDYKDIMWTKREAGAFEPLTDVDALRCVFPWKAELLPLYTDNYVSGVYRMVVESMSRFHEEQEGDEGTKSVKGYRHEVAFYMEKYVEYTWVALLGDGTETAPYRNRAADYGNLCPVRCKTYTEV